MADRYIATAEDLTSVANAIRSKSGISGSLKFPDGFVSRISGITKATYVHRSGSFKPTADGTSISIPTGTMKAAPLFYVVCAPETQSVSGTVYAAIFINYGFMFGERMPISGTYVSGEYFTRMAGGVVNRQTVSDPAIYCTASVLTPRAPSGVFRSSLTYKWFAIYKA